MGTTSLGSSSNEVSYKLGEGGVKGQHRSDTVYIHTLYTPSHICPLTLTRRGSTDFYRTLLSCPLVERSTLTSGNVSAPQTKHKYTELYNQPS